MKQNCTYRLDSSYEEGAKELHHSPPKGITRTVSDDLKVSLQFLRIEKYVALPNDQPILIWVYPLDVTCIVVQRLVSFFREFFFEVMIGSKSAIEEMA